MQTHVTGLLEDSPDNRILLLPNAGEPQVALAMIPYLHERDLRKGKAGETEDDIRKQLAEGIRARYHEVADAISSRHSGLPAIATGHLTVLGSAVSDSERDIHIGGLGEVEPGCFPKLFAYVALGHLHRPQVPKGDARVRYSGSPIALSFSESNDTKEVRLVDATLKGVNDYGLPVPVFRRLAQLKTESARAETAVEKFKPGESELTPWVEVVVGDAVLKDDLNERLRRVDVGGKFEVMTVLRGGSMTPPPGREGDYWAEEEEDLLGNPIGIFERRMDQFSDLLAKDKKELRRTFKTLLERDAEGGA
jgi:exonuclease SbcD